MFKRSYIKREVIIGIMRILYKGNIESDFEGFNENAIFKMTDGTYWLQSQYVYWYHYAYMPTAVIIQENGRTILTVKGHSVPVEQLYNVIESRIDGTFEGWQGNTKYKLTNGQIWEQVVYKYQYKYSHRPVATIANVNGSYIMSVAGTQAVVKRI